jgi:coatomer subunit beta'
VQWHHGIDYGRLILSTDLKELAFKVTNDPDDKFDLALQLDDLDSALEIVRAVPDAEAETKWKAVGDRALAVWRFALARECFDKAGDLNALMLILLSTGDQAGLRQLAIQAGEPRFLFLQEVFSHLSTERKGQNNLAFASLFQLGDAKGCVDLLAKTQRIPEAALFARTYAPRYLMTDSPDTFLMPFSSKIPEIVDSWRSDLQGKGRSKLAASIACPTEHGDLFEEGWTEAVQRETDNNAAET